MRSGQVLVTKILAPAALLLQEPNFFQRVVVFHHMRMHCGVGLEADRVGVVQPILRLVKSDRGG